MTICLGIESTAHTFGVGIVTSKGAVKANILKQFQTKEGGIVPTQAAEHHIAVCDEIVKEALEKAQLTLKDISFISFAQGPGIGHTLRVGAMTARSLAVRLGIPLIGVNHCIAHLEIGKLLTEASDPVLLYVSGANTQIIAFTDKKYRIFGETLDIGVGNMLDVFGREIGLGFPAGPAIMELAKKGNKYVELPYVLKGMDVSFGGILTNITEKYKSGAYTKEDLCYSLQETVFSMLIEACERAMAHTGKRELLLGGGVASNMRLQEMAALMCKGRDALSFAPERQFLVDNGAMIAWLGVVEYKKGKRTAIEDSAIRPYWRLDDE